ADVLEAGSNEKAYSRVRLLATKNVKGECTQASNKGTMQQIVLITKPSGPISVGVVNIAPSRRRALPTRTIFACPLAPDIGRPTAQNVAVPTRGVLCETKGRGAILKSDTDRTETLWRITTRVLTHRVDCKRLPYQKQRTSLSACARRRSL